MHLPTLPSFRAWPLAMALCVPAFAASLPAAAGGLVAARAPLVELAVIERDSAMVLPQYRHRGQAWVPGEPGQRYALRLRNRGPQRVLAVVSVDGINVVDGRTADPRQAGYVLGPWETLEIDGWRKSLDAVAGFVFVDPSASYASRTGRPANVGTIGIAVFREHVPAPQPGDRARIAGSAEAEAAAGADSYDAAPAPASAPSAQATSGYARRAPVSGGLQRAGGHSRLGTGHGRIERAPAFHTRFIRQDTPAQVTELRYDTPDALLARGIRIESAAPWHDHGPRAFPGSGFVPDPP